MILKFTNARANYLIALACVVLIAASTYLFLYQKNDPGYWDEAWHIPTAQKYIDKIFALENHPPVGKLLIAAGEKLV